MHAEYESNIFKYGTRGEVKTEAAATEDSRRQPA